MSTVSKCLYKTEVIYLRKNYCDQIEKNCILQLFFQHLIHVFHSVFILVGLVY